MKGNKEQKHESKSSNFLLHIHELGEKTITFGDDGFQSWSKLRQGLIAGALSFLIVKSTVTIIEFDEPEEKLFTSTKVK